MKPTLTDYLYAVKRAKEECSPLATVATLIETARLILAWEFDPDKINTNRIENFLTAPLQPFI